jgi:hypothetical protein
MKILQLSTLKQSLGKIHLKNFVHNPLKTKNEKYMQEGYYKISAAMSRPVSYIVDLTKDADMQRFMFLESMKKHLIRPVQNMSGLESEYAAKIYSKVTEPLAQHFSVVKRTNDSLETVSKIFDLAHDEKSLDFVQSVQYEVLDGSADSAKLIIDMLSSKNRADYIENLDRYVSYLKLNSKDADAITKLDRLIQTGKYNQTEYDNRLSVKNLMKNHAIKTFMSDKAADLEGNFSQDSERILKLLVTNYTRDKQAIQPEVQQQIIDIYKTSDEKNSELRTAILNQFKYRKLQEQENSLEEIKRLFNRIDENEDVRKFIQKVISKGMKVHSVAELNHILDITPLKKATVFFNNTKRIISISAGEERAKALKDEIENPFFVPQHKIKHTGIYSGEPNLGFISKMLKMVENEINKFRYRRMIKNQVINTTLTPAADIKTDGSKIKFRRLKPSTIEYKIRLSEDVNNVIKNMLSAKTYEKQYENYTQNATGMRLKLLPDIFSAISKEASEARKQGKPVSVKRQNALVLYKKINDRNRKMIRYMLKQTNKDGSKTFSLKNIIRTIDEIETEIATRRKADKNFKYSDTKLIYAGKYASMVSKYGKLGRNNPG